MAKKAFSRNAWGLLISGIVVVSAPVIGLLVTVLFLRGAFDATGGTSIPPSDKARVLAEGISNAMNGTAIGIGVAILAMVPTVFFLVRLLRERRENR
ncbi:MAG: MotA/TolQ/ExbB proton channel family protein [Myxococcales bacterium]|nr:MotA/TolQ/ExbB proton channel family protein [Myxococcales bacterium]MCB9583302.1 MotA/TolQ/ExbB proton channel family protein [Polyangiaceae bacterium]